jgi:hypothetical protein
LNQREWKCLFLGKNEQGQRGNNTKFNELKPILIMNLKGVESVYCGYDCSFILQNVNFGLVEKMIQVSWVLVIKSTDPHLRK